MGATGQVNAQWEVMEVGEGRGAAGVQQGDIKTRGFCHYFQLLDVILLVDGQ